jgi:hypothetical protein
MFGVLTVRRPKFRKSRNIEPASNIKALLNELFVRRITQPRDPNHRFPIVHADNLRRQ